MKNVKLPGLSLLIAVTALPATALAENSGWYLRAHGGVSSLDDTSGGFTVSGSSSKIDINTDSGSFLGLAGGYDYGNGWRAEVAWEYRTNDSTATLDGVSAFDAGDYASNTFFLNGIYAFGGNDQWRPYAGGGLAWVQEIDIDLENNGVEQSYSASGDVGFQVFAGVEYALSPKWVLGGELRYVLLSDIDFDSEAGAPGAVSGLDYRHTSAQLGITYRF